MALFHAFFILRYVVFSAFLVIPDNTVLPDVFSR